MDITIEGDQCSLRAAIQVANAAGAGPHTISVPTGTWKTFAGGGTNVP